VAGGAWLFSSLSTKTILSGSTAEQQTYLSELLKSSQSDLEKFLLQSATTDADNIFNQVINHRGTISSLVELISSWWRPSLNVSLGTLATNVAASTLSSVARSPLMDSPSTPITSALKRQSSSPSPESDHHTASFLTPLPPSKVSRSTTSADALSKSATASSSSADVSSVENNLLAGLETLFVRAPSLAALADQDWTVDALVDAMNPRVSQPGRRSTVSKQLFPSLECDLPPKSLPHLLESSDSPGTSLFARLKLCHRVKFDFFYTF